MGHNRILGLDIGYGYTKGTAYGRTSVFPSVAGDAIRGNFDNGLVTSGNGSTIEIDGLEWFYGDQARRHSRNPVALFARERTEQRDVMRVLFAATLAELNITSGAVSLATGLPVDWFTDRDELESVLRGTHSFRVNGVLCTVYVDQVATVPQPFGSLFDLLLDTGGQIVNADLARGKVGILDVGSYTTDAALCDNMEYIARASGSRTIAMSNVWRQVGDAVRSHYGLDYEPHVIDAIMRNGRTVTVQGADRSIDNLIQPAVDAIAQQVIAFARDRWGSARDFKRVLLTGGGAYLLSDQVRRVFPHLTVLAEPHTANLRGFYKYAVRKFAG